MDVHDSLAWLTRSGIGATIAGGLFWTAIAATLFAHGLSVEALAWSAGLGGLAVQPVGYVFNRWLGGDALARGHPLAGLVWTLGATQWLGWVTVAVLFVQAPVLVPYALATLVGAHFLPFAWLYRSRAYAVLGVVSVLGAGIAQLALPTEAPRWIATGMAMAMLAAAWVEHRRFARHASRAPA